MDMTGRTLLKATAIVLLLSAIAVDVQDETSNGQPVANAGLSRYVATDLIQLDGTQSYDPGQSGPLSYVWTQVSGPPVTIAAGVSSTPTISGFVQTDEMQECLISLVVSDGAQESLPATVSIKIVPKFGRNSLFLHNDFFDVMKPTIIYFLKLTDFLCWFSCGHQESL